MACLLRRKEILGGSRKIRHRPGGCTQVSDLRRTSGFLPESRGAYGVRGRRSRTNALGVAGRP